MRFSVHTPVIAFNRGSVPEIVEDGLTGSARNCASAFASSSGLMAFSWSLMVSSSYQADRDDDREAKRREDGAQKLSSIMMRPGSSNSRHVGGADAPHEAAARSHRLCCA